jgi:hypothetical protein
MAGLRQYVPLPGTGHVPGLDSIHATLRAVGDTLVIGRGVLGTGIREDPWKLSSQQGEAFCPLENERMAQMNVRLELRVETFVLVLPSPSGGTSEGAMRVIT